MRLTELSAAKTKLKRNLRTINSKNSKSSALKTSFSPTNTTPLRSSTSSEPSSVVTSTSWSVSPGQRVVTQSKSTDARQPIVKKPSNGSEIVLYVYS